MSKAEILEVLAGKPLELKGIDVFQWAGFLMSEHMAL